MCKANEICARAALSILTVRDGVYMCLLLVVSYARWRLNGSQLTRQHIKTTAALAAACT